jgi:hypothetical protein
MALLLLLSPPWLHPFLLHVLHQWRHLLLLLLLL